jgi:hypothetical protein
MIKIDKQIPIPNGRNKYPFAEMEIGDSFFVANVRSSNIQLRYYKPKQFTRRSVVKDGVQGVRVWRIA